MGNSNKSLRDILLEESYGCEHTRLTELIQHHITAAKENIEVVGFCFENWRSHGYSDIDIIGISGLADISRHSDSAKMLLKLSHILMAEREGYIVKCPMCGSYKVDEDTGGYSCVNCGCEWDYPLPLE